MAGAEQAYVLARDWLGDLAAPVSSASFEARPPSGDPAAPALPDDSIDRDAALSDLAVRYLAGHGPADARDLAVWSGLPLRDARRGFALAAESSLVETLDDGQAVTRGGSGARLREDAPDQAVTELAALPSRLLGPFDPVLHGWASRDWVTGPHRGIVTVNGIFRPIALVAGRAAATWTMPAGKVVLSPLGPLTPQTEAALQAQADDVHRFLADAAS